MIVASVAGIAYGYNYCMAEFLTLTSRSEVTVFMRRGKFYDPPDIKSPLVNPSGRRSGAGFEDELNANMTSDYDESMRRARAAASKSLGEAWVKSDDTRRYAERLTKFSDNVDSNDVIMVSVHVTPSTTIEDLRRVNDDSAKYSDSEEALADNDAETSKTTLSSTTLDARKYDSYNNLDKTWKFAEEFNKYAGGEKLVMENTPLVTTRSTTTVDNSWQFAEQLYKYVDGTKHNENVVRVETPAPPTTLDTRNGDNVESTWKFSDILSKAKMDSKDKAAMLANAPTPFGRPTRTPGLSEFNKHADPTRRGYLNFLKPLRTDPRKNLAPEESNNYTKGRMSPRRTTQRRSNSKIKFVERKHHDSKATLAPMRHWATRTTPKASEEYNISEEDDEDIVYKSV